MSANKFNIDFSSVGYIKEKLIKMEEDLTMIIQKNERELNFRCFANQRSIINPRSIEVSLNEADTYSVIKPILFVLQSAKLHLDSEDKINKNRLIFEMLDENNEPFSGGTLRLNMKSAYSDNYISWNLSSIGYSYVVIEYNLGGNGNRVYGTNNINDESYDTLGTDLNYAQTMKACLNTGTTIEVEYEVIKPLAQDKRITINLWQKLMLEDEEYWIDCFGAKQEINDGEPKPNLLKNFYPFEYKRIGNKIINKQDDTFIIEPGNSKLTLVMHNELSGETLPVYRHENFTPSMREILKHYEGSSYLDQYVLGNINSNTMNHFHSMQEKQANFRIIESLKELAISKQIGGAIIQDDKGGFYQKENISSKHLSEVYVKDIYCDILHNRNLEKNENFDFFNEVQHIDLLCETIWIDAERKALERIFVSTGKAYLNREVNITSISEMEAQVSFFMFHLNSPQTFMEYKNNKWSSLTTPLDGVKEFVSIDVGHGSSQLQSWLIDKDNVCRSTNDYYVYASGGRLSGGRSFFKQIWNYFEEMAIQINTHVLLAFEDFKELIIRDLFKDDVFMHDLLREDSSSYYDTHMSRFVTILIPTLIANTSIIQDFKIFFNELVNSYFSRQFEIIDRFRGNVSNEAIIVLNGRFNYSIVLAYYLDLKGIRVVRPKELETVNVRGSAYATENVQLNLEPTYWIKVKDEPQTITLDATLSVERFENGDMQFTLVETDEKLIAMRYDNSSKNEEMNQSAFIMRSYASHTKNVDRIPHVAFKDISESDESANTWSRLKARFTKNLDNKKTRFTFTLRDLREGTCKYLEEAPSATLVS